MKNKQVGFECINNQINTFELRHIIVKIDMKSTFYVIIVVNFSRDFYLLPFCSIIMCNLIFIIFYY